MNVEVFERYRPLLFSVAYRMLGTATEAEDVLQDAYLRVLERPSSTEVEKPKYYLTTVVTRLCLNHLSSAKTKREQYLGPWLPEPVLTEGKPELVTPLEGVMTAESVSIAFLVLLESLSPAERAVFLLHEVFGYKHHEVAEMLEKSETACRQLFSRAKQHVAENRPRFKATPEQHERLLEGFVKAVGLGEVEAFSQLLAEDVTFVADGGGEAGAAINILRGQDTVARFLLGTYRRAAPKNLQYEITTLNGQRAMLARTGEGLPFFAMFVYGESDAVQLIHVIAGRKLAAIANG